MRSSFKPIGQLINLVDNRNTDCAVTYLLGLNILKAFMPSVANVSTTDLSKYKVIRKGQFAYSPMQTGRDETIRVALYQGDQPAIISPAYSVFEIKDTSEVLPEFVMIWFLRSESDRYGWFISDSSVRSSLDWERFCEIEIPIPPIKGQKQHVNLYRALIKNQQCYEGTINDLQLISNAFLEVQSKKGKQRLEPYIRKVDTRNTNLSVESLRGISTSKQFITSNANTTGVDFSGYRVVQPNQFAYVPDTSRRGDKIALAMNKTSDLFIISAIYSVFEVKIDSGLLPEYLYLWFSRPEFDRYARYHSWGSARETFDWSDMCDVMLPIPTIEEQKSIVAIHHALETRKQLNDRLKEIIRPLCPVLMQGVIQDLKAAV